jgi:hypothetical protein
MLDPKTIIELDYQFDNEQIVQKSLTSEHRITLDSNTLALNIWTAYHF